MSGRFALVIATNQYEDPGLQQLHAPAQDAEALARILSAPNIGDFKVQTILNEPAFKASQAIETFFTDRNRDDLLLFYFSGHGLKDDEGRLYFATPDTRRNLLRTTAIQAALVNDVMRYSRSKRQVLVLDCCYSGAFARGMVVKAGEALGAPIDTRERFEGAGRLILTASDSLQYAFEGDEIKGEGVRSVFTRALVHGLESGEADLDKDGNIALEELYRYVHSRVTEQVPQQRPRMWAFDVDEGIIIARNPLPPVPKVSLPGWISEALNSNVDSTRLVAVSELAQLIRGQDEDLAALAQAQLDRMSQEDVNAIVRGAAAGALTFTVSGAPVHRPPTSPPPAQEEVDKTEKLPPGSHPPVQEEVAQIGQPSWDSEFVMLGRGIIFAVLISPDGRSLAVAGSVGVWLYDMESFKLLRWLQGHTDTVSCVAWSPDGKRIASGDEGDTVRLWDVASGAELRTLEGHEGFVRSVAWSPDGKQLVTGDGAGVVRLWDAAIGREMHALEGRKGHEYLVGGVSCVAWSPDGKRIASASSYKTALWEAASGQKLRNLVGPRDVRSMAWSPDGKQLAGGDGGGAVQLWNVANGKKLHTLEGHDDLVWSVAWSPDGKRIASGSLDRTVRIWDAASGKELRILEGHKGIVCCVAWSSDGEQLASVTWDAAVRIWDVKTGKQVKRRAAEGYGSEVMSVVWSRDGKQLVSGDADGTVRLWDVASWQELSILKNHKSGGNYLALSADGKQLASGRWGDKTVRLWDSAGGGEVRLLEGHEHEVISVAWSPDGKQLASSSLDKTVRLWDAANGRELRTLKAHSNDVNSVAWSPDMKRLALGSSDKTVRLWDAASGEELRRLEGHADSVQSVAWSSDGKRLASGSLDKTVQLWNAAGGQELQRLEGHTDGVICVAWSPDGNRLASGDEGGTLRTWDASGRELRTFEGHKHSINALAWSPNGKWVASGSEDGTVRIWEIS